jgi:type IX secretion system substrate protein
MEKSLLLFLTLFVTTAMGQSLKPEVIATSGTSFSDGTSQLDWTLGEPVTAALTSGTDMLTEGFHQPQLIVTSIEHESDGNISVAPNPTIGYLNVRVTDINTIIQLYTIEGKLLQSKVAETKDLHIDMATYTAGNYLLCIKELTGKTKTFKIVKSN